MSKQIKPSLKEDFVGLMSDVFRAAGFTVSVPGQENLEKLSGRFTDAIKKEARDAALVLARRLQEATLNGFEKFATSFNTLENKVEKLESELRELEDKFSYLNKSVLYLRDR